MNIEQAINIAKGCVMASHMDSETKQTVVEALNQVAISKTETVGVSSDGFSYDAKPKQYQCHGCRNYFYMPQVPAYCPNCGRRLEATPKASPCIRCPEEYLCKYDWEHCPHRKGAKPND